MNPGIHNHRMQRHRGPWVDWGPKRRWRYGKEPSRMRRSDSNQNFPIKMVSKFFSKTTIVFIVKIASREYLTRLNRSTDEEVMVVLQKPRSPTSKTPDHREFARPGEEKRRTRAFCAIFEFCSFFLFCFALLTSSINTHV